MLKLKGTLGILILVSVLMSLISGISFAQSQPEFVIDAAMLPMETFQQGPTLFKRRVEALTGGRVQVNLLLSPTLGSGPEIVEMVEWGELQMTFFSQEAIMSNWLPEIEVMNLPFMIKDNMVAEKLMTGPWLSKLQGLFEQKVDGLRLMSVAGSQVRHLYLTKEIRTPSDIREQGLRMRVMEAPLHVTLWESLGATVVALPQQDRYTALQTGMMDGIEGGISSSVQSNLMEVADHVILNGYQYAFFYVVANDEWFRSLPRDIQEIVAESAAMSAWADYGSNALTNYRDLEKLKEIGSKIIILNDDEIQAWRDECVPAVRDYLVRTYGAEIVEEFMEAVAEAEGRVLAHQRGALPN